ncbi:MAG: RNA polymerase factor sigma-32 [Deltaproteobacteria bacterium]
MKPLAINDSLGILANQIQSYPLLTREQEIELAQRYRAEGDVGAAEKLVVSNLRFVVKIASEYASYGFQILDLFQEGSMGLMQAVKKFNPDRGYRLISYAVWWIRARIHNFIMRSWSVVKMGTTQAQRKLFHKIGRGKKRLAIDRDDASAENLKRVADLFGVKEREVMSMEIRTASRDFSLDSSTGEDESSAKYADLIPDTSANQEEVVAAAEMSGLTQEGLRIGLQSLTPKERYVVESRYLLEPPAKLGELGDELGVSKERVRQIEVQALRKLNASIQKRLRCANI